MAFYKTNPLCHIPFAPTQAAVPGGMLMGGVRLQEKLPLAAKTDVPQVEILGFLPRCRTLASRMLASKQVKLTGKCKRIFLPHKTLGGK